MYRCNLDHLDQRSTNQIQRLDQGFCRSITVDVFIAVGIGIRSMAIDTEFQAKYEKKATIGRHGCKTKVLFTYILFDFRGVPTLI